MAFVCAFRGARDRYQAPVALAEGHMLDRFITDAYVTPVVQSVLPFLPPSARAAFASRHAAGIPDNLVDCLWPTTFLEHARHRLGFSRRVTWLKLDRHFSEAAAARARSTRADLFLYSPYAWEAFVASYAHTPKRVLFQYHPHPDLESRILADDAGRFPGYGESFNAGRAETVAAHLLTRERDSWRHADLVLCASAFTRRSLVEAGCDEQKCRVIPYGIDLPAAPAAPVDERFRVLFVGSGGQRKGLHHLLLAWQKAALPSGVLTLVCRAIDRNIEALARSIAGVEIIPGAAPDEIERLYAGSTLFAMPSMVEGFGQVYLEALAQGCPVLGTSHTCLPDLGGEDGGVFLCEPANVNALADRLHDLAMRLPGAAAMRAAARATAARFPWSAFRTAVRQAVHA